MADVKVGGAYVEIGARSEKARKAFAAIEKSMKKVGQQMAKLGAKIAGLGAVITGPLVLAAKSFAQFGDTIGKIAARTGLTTQAISELGFVANIVGQDVNALEKGVRGMQRAIHDAERGSIEIVEALQVLGFSFRDLKGLSPEKQFELIGGAIGEMVDPSLKAAIAMKVFGKAGAGLIPMFNLGKKGMAALRKEARELGVSMSDTSGAEELTDNLFRVSQAMQGIKNSIATVLLPNLQDLTLRITGVLVQIRKWIEANPQIIQGLFRIGKTLLAVGTAMAAFGAAFVVAVNPIIIVLGAISIAVLSILESFGIVSVGINSDLKSVFSGFAIFGKSLEDWGGMLTRTLKTLFLSLMEGIVSGVEWATNKISNMLGWIEDKFARFFDLIMGVDKEVSDAAAKARKIRRQGGGSAAGDLFGGLRENLTARRDASAREALKFDIESSERGEKLPSFSKFADKMKALLDFKFKPINIPKLSGIGDVGGDSLLPDKKSIVGFFGGAGSASEILGGAAKTNGEQQLSEARKQTSLLDRIAINTRGNAGAIFT